MRVPPAPGLLRCALSLKRLYGLTEATRSEKQVSLQWVEKNHPEAMSCFDRDVGTEVDTKQASFYLEKDGTPLVANVYGGGWWQWYPDGSIFTGKSEASWGKISKPASIRGGSGRQKDPDFQGNPYSHQDVRTGGDHKRQSGGYGDVMTPDGVQVDDAWVTRRFGHSVLKKADQIMTSAGQNADGGREFIAYRIAAWKPEQPGSKQRSNRKPYPSPQTVTLIMNLIGPDEIDNVVTDTYEYNERDDKWEGPT